MFHQMGEWWMQASLAAINGIVGNTPTAALDLGVNARSPFVNWANPDGLPWPLLNAPDTHDEWRALNEG